MKKPFTKNLLAFSPLLVLYIVLILAFSPNHLIDDEPRHLSYATNLTNGFYADLENPSLRNGPGYPLAIAIPVLLNASHDFIRLINAPLLFFAVIFFYKSVSLYARPRKALFISYLLGLYPIALKGLLGILSESLALFLICGFLYFFLKLHNQESKRTTNLILSGIFLGVLALTKVIIGYVILSGIVGCLLAYFFTKTKKVKASILVLVIGFMFCIPYLGYTYSITGKAFVWGTQGGEIMYWRSTPFENEVGNWVSIEDVVGSEGAESSDKNQLYENHGAFIESLIPLSFLERDALFKKKAIENINEYPIKYVKNTVASASRLFFNYPYTNTPQKISTNFYLLPNMFLLVFLVLAFYLFIKNFKTFPFEIYFLGFMALIFIGGLTLLDGRVRHLLPIVPILILFITFVFKRFITINVGRSDILES